MVSLTVVFWLYVILFAIIGSLRGWAKELLVTFSVVLALFLITVLETYVAPLKGLLKEGGRPRFWMEVVILIVMTFFGYQTPNIKGIGGPRFARERLQDILLGFLLGAINGYLVVGCFWFFLDAAKYPFKIITPPIPGNPLGDEALRIIAILPPHWLGIPWIYFAVGVAFIFVLIVFL